MARQIGIIKLRGTYDDLIFYKSKDGFLVRRKGGIEKSRIKNDPCFARTRENNSEFGRAGKSGKKIRGSFACLIKRVKGGRSSARFHKLIMQVFKTDTTSIRGERCLEHGDLSLITGFEFNTGSALSAVFIAPFTVTVDRAAGKSTVDIDAFNPLESVNVPDGATHFRIFAGSSEVDFQNEQQAANSGETGWMPWDGVEVKALSLPIAVSTGSILPVITLLGIEFAQEFNGQIYPMGQGSVNALRIVDVDRV